MWRFLAMGPVENPVNNKEYRIPGEAKEMLKSLASKWEDIDDANSLQVIPLKGAMTNEVFQIKWPTKTQNMSRKVVVRIYGEGVEVFLIETLRFLRLSSCRSKGRDLVYLGGSQMDGLKSSSMHGYFDVHLFLYLCYHES